MNFVKNLYIIVLLKHGNKVIICRGNTMLGGDTYKKLLCLT